MNQLNIPTPSDERDTFAIRSLILLSILLFVSSYLYRTLVTNQAYEQPLAKISRPSLVQTQGQSSTE